ncbi:MAG TPA: hypothetical protein VMG58_05595 [Candidatus Sulfotelmatobacter sp.]|nr:hypothetical protein [Candidatus Sulfotelmatobacter sp.]
MDGAGWVSICTACGFAKAAATRAEVVFAIEKHARFTGHPAWDVHKVKARTPDTGPAVSHAADRLNVPFQDAPRDGRRP